MGTVAALALVSGGLVAASAATAGGNTGQRTGTYTVWGDAAPSGSVDTDTSSVELGTVFTPTQDGTVLGIRFYKTPENTGRHVGHLWTSAGTLLATVTFTNESRRGWQTATLSNPVQIKAGQKYVASYLAPNGRYFQAENFQGSSTTPLISIEKGRSGVYRYGSRGGFPTKQWHSSQYRADVVFDPSGTVPPAATASPTSSPSTSMSPTATPRPTASASATATPRPTASASATATPRPTATPTTSPSPSASPSSTPSTSPSSTPLPTTPGATTLSLPRVPWWGGPAYYAKFSKAAASGWTDPSFFPISVFVGKPEHASRLKAIGVNTYMAAEHDGSSMSSITRTGMQVIAQDEWSPAEVGDDPRVVGWFLSDECDMGLGGCDGDQYASLAKQKSYADRVRGYNDGRFAQANFGNGALGTYWSSDTMDDQVGLVDVSSVDKYAYSSPDVNSLFRSTPAWPKDKAPASAGAYGWLQDRMEIYSSPASSKPNWVFVETARPYLTDNGARTITGDQIEGAVWNSIIHGASGIAYFQHNNDPACGNYSLLECGTALTNKVAAIDAQVARLAPVINTQSYQWTFGSGLDTSLKAQGGYAYIFAMSDGGTGQRTFSLPPEIRGTSVEVVDEGRKLTVSGGTFSDTFTAEHAHHIYRVALGG